MKQTITAWRLPYFKKSIIFGTNNIPKDERVELHGVYKNYKDAKKYCAKGERPERIKITVEVI